MNSIGNFVTMQCSAGRLGVLAFKWMTLDPYHPPKHCHRPSSPPHGNSTGLPLRTQATTTATNLLGVVVVTMQASVITYAGDVAFHRSMRNGQPSFQTITLSSHGSDNLYQCDCPQLVAVLTLLTGTDALLTLVLTLLLCVIL